MSPPKGCAQARAGPAGLGRSQADAASRLLALFSFQPGVTSFEERLWQKEKDSSSYQSRAPTFFIELKNNQAECTPSWCRLTEEREAARQGSALPSRCSCCLRANGDVTNGHVAACYSLPSCREHPLPPLTPPASPVCLVKNLGWDLKAGNPTRLMLPHGNTTPQGPKQIPILKSSGSRGEPSEGQDAGLASLTTPKCRPKLHQKECNWISLVTLMLPTRLFITLSMCTCPTNTGLI